jgi:hypothetical protein
VRLGRIRQRVRLPDEHANDLFFTAANSSRAALSSASRVAM